MKDTNNIFPPKPEHSELSDDEWVRDCIGVWCCNSLNERAGSNRMRAFNKSGSLVFVQADFLLLNAEMFERAQNVIQYLIQEIDRLKGEEE